MDFKDMKKIWNEQNQETMYAINESVLHDQIKCQKKRTIKMTSIIEILIISVNIFISIFLVVLSFIKDNHKLTAYLMVLVMIITAIYTYLGRRKRLKSENKFGSSLLQDLDEAISVANYKVNLSGKLVSWYLAAIIGISLLTLIQSGAEWWIYPLVILFFGLTVLAGRWEHKSIHLARRNKLINLRKQLTEQ